MRLGLGSLGLCVLGDSQALSESWVLSCEESEQQSTSPETFLSLQPECIRPSCILTAAPRESGAISHKEMEAREASPRVLA